MNYIDGFAVPIPKDRLDSYRSMVQQIAEVWREYGALDYREFVSEAPKLEGTRCFAEAAGARDDEVVIFGWVAFASREARDLANEKVAADPRMADLMNADAGFDGARMIYGGFEPLF